MQSLSAKSFLKYVKDGTHDLDPMIGTHREVARSRNETMLRLLYEHFGLAQALLVIYSFFPATTEDFHLILRCFIRKRGHFYCGALEAEAADILSNSYPKTPHLSSDPDSIESVSPVIPQTQTDPTESTAIQRMDAQSQTTTAISSGVSILDLAEEDGTTDAGHPPETQNVGCPDSPESINPNKRLDEQSMDCIEYTPSR
ncbi:hypothetical protein N7523_005710 [Penicillium sp. IBT 18751x]|nr:hypothetical protein N7523_005710 [Penicillium sp. IBT 18751x]